MRNAWGRINQARLQDKLGYKVKLGEKFEIFDILKIFAQIVRTRDDLCTK